jgi:hypothetical protein
MSRVPCTRPALDIEFLTGYLFVLNDPEVTMPPRNLLADADLRRRMLPLSAVRCPLSSVPVADRWRCASGTTGAGTVRTRTRTRVSPTSRRSR